MSVPFSEIQKAVYDRLQSPLLALTPAVPIYDQPTLDTPFPFVHFVDFSMLPAGLDKNTNSWRVELELNAWTSGESLKFLDTVLDTVLSELRRAPLLIPGFNDLYGLGEVLNLSASKESLRDGEVSRRGEIRYQWTVFQTK
jgi:hypothetical protein